jgi:hypothetical protein
MQSVPEFDTKPVRRNGKTFSPAPKLFKKLVFFAVGDGLSPLKINSTQTGVVVALNFDRQCGVALFALRRVSRGILSWQDNKKDKREE